MELKAAICKYVCAAVPKYVAKILFYRGNENECRLK